jgi:hypothetical protein
MIFIGYAAFLIVSTLTVFFSISVLLAPEAHRKLPPVQQAHTVKRTAEAGEAPPRVNARKGEWGPRVGAVAVLTDETRSTKRSVLVRKNARQRPRPHLVRALEMRGQIAVQPREDHSERMGYASEPLRLIRRW